uniref:Uncharacterized protein n=1 Tax=Cacopsylla melanoneura TaxID=428564 RepID=A0A8D8VM33_9HEMI
MIKLKMRLISNNISLFLVVFAVQVNTELESNSATLLPTLDKLGTDSDQANVNTTNNDKGIQETKYKNLEETNSPDIVETKSYSDTPGPVNNVENNIQTDALKDEIIKQFLLKEIQTPVQASSDVQHDEKQKVLRHLLSNILSNSNDQGNGTQTVDESLNKSQVEESSMKSENDGSDKKETLTENDSNMTESPTNNNGPTNLSNQLSKIPIQQLLKTPDGFIPQGNPNRNTKDDSKNNNNVVAKDLNDFNAIPKNSMFAIPQSSVNQLTNENPLQTDKQSVENGSHAMANEENQTHLGQLENAENDTKNNSTNTSDTTESKRLSTDTESLTSDRTDTKEENKDENSATTPSSPLETKEENKDTNENDTTPTSALETKVENKDNDENGTTPSTSPLETNEENKDKDGKGTTSPGVLDPTMLAVPVNLNNNSSLPLNDLGEQSIANLPKNISGMTFDQIQSFSDQDILKNLEETQTMDTNVLKRVKSNPNAMREYISPPEHIPYIDPIPNLSASTNDIGKPATNSDSPMTNLLANNPFTRKTPTDSSDVDPRILKSMSDAELQVALISLLASMTPSRSNQVTLEPTGYGTFQTYIGDVDLNIELVPIQSNRLTRKNAKEMFKDVSKVVGNINSKLPPGTDQVIKAVIKATVPGGSEAIAVGELVAKVAKKQKEGNKPTFG